MGAKKQVQQRITRMIHSKHMLTSIGIASFLEATIVPIPLETLLIPLMQAKRKQLWTIAAVTTLGCILGALLGYAVGYFLFDLLRDWVMLYITTDEQFAHFQAAMQRDGFWFVFSTGITPVPLQIAMLAAGVAGYSLGLYLLAVTLSRCIRYFGIGLLVKLFGNKTEKTIRKYKWRVGICALVIITTVIGIRLYLTSTGN